MNRPNGRQLISATDGVENVARVPGARNQPLDIPVFEEGRSALQPSLQIGELAGSEMVTPLIAQIVHLLAALSRSTTRT